MGERQILSERPRCPTLTPKAKLVSLSRESDADTVSFGDAAVCVLQRRPEIQIAGNLRFPLVSCNN